MKKIVSALFIAGLLCVSPTLVNAQKKFKVVLDPGHGGDDPGNLGVKGSGYIEKDIVLKIAKKVGKLLEKDKTIQVLYTRKTDVSLGLKERGEFAHDNKADIFVSIHCDAFSSAKAFGAGTFVLAPRGNGGNLRVAQKENAVIAYEENYQEKYKGFDSESLESIIGNKLIQEEHLDESLLLASLIQEKIVKETKRKDRLVRQDNFQVLRETFMPSVLIEAGFLTNKKEGAYLYSEKGQTELAKAIYAGIIEYKKGYDANLVVEPPKPKEKPKPIVEKPRTFKGVTFKVQIASSAKKVNTASKNFKGLKGIERIRIGAHHKYYYGKTSDYKKVKKLKEEAKKKGYGSAFIVAFKNGKKVSVRSVLNAKK